MTIGTRKSLAVAGALAWGDDFAHARYADTFAPPPDPPEQPSAGVIPMPPLRRGRTPGRSNSRSSSPRTRSSRGDDDGDPAGGDGTAPPSSAPATPPELLTVPEAAELLRTTPKGIYAMVGRGFLDGAVRRIGRRVLLKREALLASTGIGLGPSPRRTRR